MDGGCEDIIYSKSVIFINVEQETLTSVLTRPSGKLVSQADTNAVQAPTAN